MLIAYSPSSCGKERLHTGTKGQRRNAEDVGEGLTYIGECDPRTQIDARPNTETHSQERNVLSRMVGARGRGVVPMVARDDQQVTRTESGHHLAQSRVEPLEIRREA